MQKLIAKYGLAAHLALLAVAPLILWPYVGEGAIAIVLLWLSLPALVWVLLEPSVRSGEGLHDARRRVWRSMLADPLFWASLVLIVVTGLRAFNDGVSLSYDAEKMVWHIAEPQFPILPGSVGAAGFLPFATAVAFAVLLQGCRQSLGRSARMAFLLVSSFLAGLSSILVLVTYLLGREDLGAVFSPENAACSYVGLVYGFHLLGATVALFAAFERVWRVAMLLAVVALAGTSAGLFACSPAYVSAGMAGAELLLFVYCFFLSHKTLRSGAEFKMLVFLGIAFVLGGLLAVAALPPAQLNGRLATYRELAFFTPEFWKTRAALSAMAFKAWISHLWIGTGLDSFAFDFRFNAGAKDWELLPRGATALANGWWKILAERGLVGMSVYVLPFGFLLFTYFRRLFKGDGLRQLPHPAALLAPIVLLLLAADGFFDCTLMRAETILVTTAMLAVSAAAFSMRKRREDG